jgi:hypothetical protein
MALMLLVTVASSPGAAATRRDESDASPAAAAAAGGEFADLADSLDYGIERIFRFVADEIRYEPYAGLLRGARGKLGRSGAAAGGAPERELRPLSIRARATG